MKQLTEGQRITHERLLDIQRNAVRSDRFDCGCVRHTDANGRTSIFLHRGASVGHKPVGKTTDQKAFQKATREARSRPNTVTRDGTDSPSIVQAEIRLINAKGDSKTLADVKTLKTLHARAARLNAEESARTDAEIDRAREVFRARKAQRPETIDVMRATRAELRDRSLDVIERDGGHLEPHQLDQIDALVRDVSEFVNPVTICRRLLTTESPAYRSAFMRSIQPHQGAAGVFTAEEQAAVIAYRAASDGGTAGLGVPILIDPTVIPAAGASAAPVLQMATTIVVTTDIWKGVTSSTPSWGWKGEAAAADGITPSLSQPVINVYTADGYIQTSYELQMDYPNFAEEMQTLLAQGYVDMVANSTITGSGSSQPFGVFVKMAATTTNPAHVVVTTAGQLSATDVRKAWVALPQRWRANSTWLANGSVESLVKNFGTSGSSLVDYQTTLAPDGSRISALEGRPLITSDYCPSFTGSTSGAAGITGVAAVVGDFRNGMRVISRAGMEVEAVKTNVPNLPTSNVPTMQHGLYATARVGWDIIAVDSMRVIANA